MLVRLITHLLIESVSSEKLKLIMIPMEYFQVLLLQIPVEKIQNTLVQVLLVVHAGLLLLMLLNLKLYPHQTRNHLQLKLLLQQHVIQKTVHQSQQAAEKKSNCIVILSWMILALLKNRSEFIWAKYHSDT